MKSSGGTPPPGGFLVLSRLIANVARTTAGTILRKLESNGHVTLSYRRINILAPDALRMMLRD